MTKATVRMTFRNDREPGDRLPAAFVYYVWPPGYDRRERCAESLRYVRGVETHLRHRTDPNFPQTSFRCVGAIYSHHLTDGSAVDVYGLDYSDSERFAKQDPTPNRKKILDVLDLKDYA